MMSCHVIQHHDVNIAAISHAVSSRCCAVSGHNRKSSCNSNCRSSWPLLLQVLPVMTASILTGCCCCCCCCCCFPADDLTFIWLVLLNEYIMPVPEVADTTKGTDLPSLICMIRNCGRQIVDCVTDASCKAGLDCLEGCAFNDQVGYSRREYRSMPWRRQYS